MIIKCQVSLPLFHSPASSILHIPISAPGRFLPLLSVFYGTCSCYRSLFSAFFGNELLCSVKPHYFFSNCLRMPFVIREKSKTLLAMLLQAELRFLSICFKRNTFPLKKNCMDWIASPFILFSCLLHRLNRILSGGEIPKIYKVLVWKLSHS